VIRGQKTSTKEFLDKISWRDVRNAVFGLLVVFGGLGLAFITLYAQWAGNPRLAGAAAIASLVFVVLILLFVVPPLARSASREVSYLDLPIELTGGGLIFLGVVGIVGFAAWNTGNNLLFLVLSFLLSAFAVSLILGSSNLKKLEARVRFPEAIFAGEPTVFTVELKNRKWLLPSFSITVALRGAMTDDKFGGRKFKFIKPPDRFAAFFRLPFLKRAVGYFIHVPRRGGVEQQTEQLFERRGRFIIRDFELATLYPFGFWRQRKRLQVIETAIYAFPKLEDVRGFLRSTQRQLGQFTTQKRGAGQDLLGLRDYQTSDDIRLVDWKATARTGQITVREFSSDDDRRVSVILLIEAADTERTERGISLAASLISFYIKEKAEVRLSINNETTDFGIGRAHLHELLRRLSTAEEKSSETEIEIPPSEGDLQIIVTPNSDKIYEQDNQIILPY
jgi:hypothetical protein